MTALNVLGYPAGARVAWEAAGGAVPSLGGVEYGGNEVTSPNLGASPSIVSTFGRIGKECFATMRIHSGASGRTAGEGFTTVQGLPVAPRYQGAGAEGGQNVGYGFLFNGASGLMYPLTAVIDPAFSLTKPLLFCTVRPVTIAAEDPDVTVWGQNYFGANALFAVHGAVDADGWPGGAAETPHPFSLADEYRLNMTFQYEGV